MVLAAALVGSGVSGWAQGQLTTWTGPAAGSWSVAANWNNGVPNAAGFTAIVDGGNAQNTVATVNTSFTVGTLNISAGDQVAIANAQTLAVTGLISNLGTISINAAANNTSLSTGGGSLLINGGGTIVMSGANAIIGHSGTLTNANNTIVGQGAIAGNGMFFINQGTVNANVNGGDIFIDPVASGMTNNGTLTSSNGGVLRFTGQFTGGMTNTGTVSAQNGSVTQFESNFGITGGTFTTSGTGVVQTAASNTANYASLANRGNWRLENNSTSNYTGDLFNSGSINFNGVNNDVIMNFNTGTTNLTGAGTINMGSAGSGEAVIGNGNGRLVNVNNFIRGAGRLGNNNQRFTNGAAGIVQADVTGSRLFVDPVAEADAFVNNGILRATNGGILQMTGQFGGGITNTGTILASGAGSEVQLLNTIGVTGGTFASTAGGIIRTGGGQIVNIASITSTGNWTLDNNSTTNYTGDLVNSGSINFTGVNNDVLLNFNSGTTNLTGAGTINMGSTGSGEAAIGNGNGRLVNVNNFIRGAGRLGSNNQRFTNGASGIVQADVSGVRLFVDPVAEADSFVNNGIMRATGGGILQFTGQFGGGVTNTGTISAQTGSEVQMLSGIGITGGTINSAGTGVIRVLDGNTAGVASVTLAGNVVIGNNATFNLSPGTITNSGSINLNAGTNNATMNVVSGGTVTLNGGGTVNLANATGTLTGGALINGSGTLVNVNNTIRGAGTLASNNIAVVNNSVVSADLNGRALFVDPVSGGGTVDFTNNGTMQASNGGFLQLSGQFGGGLINTNGRIIANNGSTVQLFSGVGISGGTFSTVGTGAVEVAAGNIGFIANNTNLGVFNIQNNSTLNASGTLTHNGHLNLNPAASNSAFNANAPLVMTGTGTVNLNAGTNGGAFFGGTGSSIDIGAGLTIRGVGTIASNNAAMINRGTINADTAGQVLFVDPVALAGGFVNNNLMTATNGGLLRFSGQFGGEVTNNGTISAQNGSRVQLLSTVVINGGTFTSSGTGGVDVAQANSGIVNNVANLGVMNVFSSANLSAGGTLLNNGTINLSPGAGNAVFSNHTGTLVVSGTGSINMNTGTASAILGVSGGPIDIGAGQTVRGRGIIANNNVAIINRGSIVAADGGELFVDPIAVADGFQNLGTMRANTGSQLQFTGQFGGGVNNTGGHINIDAGGTLLTTTSHALSGGTVTLNGVWNATNSSGTTINFVRGAGTLNVNSSARVNITAGGGTLGTSKVSSLNITTSGKLDLNDHDMIVDYTGSTPIDTIRTFLQSGYNNGAWDGTQGILSTTAGASGLPKTAIGYAEASQILGGAGGPFSGQTADGTSVLLRYTVAGDANLNKTVNLDDFTALAANFGNAGLWVSGDFNYNGLVNLDDFTILAANFGQSIPTDLPRGAAVPEPASAGLLLAAAGALTRIRRRR